MEIKGITTKSSTGEINGHEWLEEMFRKVDCSFTQLGVVVLKLTIIVNQMYSLMKQMEFIVVIYLVQTGYRGRLI